MDCIKKILSKYILTESAFQSEKLFCSLKTFENASTNQKKKYKFKYFLLDLITIICCELLTNVSNYD